MVKKKHPKNWLREIRKTQGLSSPKLAKMVGVTPEAITYIERSERALTLEMAKKLGNALGVHYIDIIDGPTPDAPVPQNERQKEVLRIMQSMGEKEQEAFTNVLRASRAAAADSKPDKIGKKAKK